MIQVDGWVNVIFLLFRVTNGCRELVSSFDIISRTFGQVFSFQTFYASRAFAFFFERPKHACENDSAHTK